jgi:hypothetical protein
MQDGFLGASTSSLEVFIVVVGIEFTLEVFLLAPEFLAFILESVELLQQSMLMLFNHLNLGLGVEILEGDPISTWLGLC